MRKPDNECLADNRDAVADRKQTERKPADNKRQISGDPYTYMFEGYEIHETFDPNGPTFPDCIVRVFA
jgi:hypothetical protein